VSWTRSTLGKPSGILHSLSSSSRLSSPIAAPRKEEPSPSTVVMTCLPVLPLHSHLCRGLHNPRIPMQHCRSHASIQEAASHSARRRDPARSKKQRELRIERAGVLESNKLSKEECFVFIHPVYTSRQCQLTHRRSREANKPTRRDEWWAALLQNVERRNVSSNLTPQCLHHNAPALLSRCEHNLRRARRVRTERDRRLRWCAPALWSLLLLNTV